MADAKLTALTALAAPATADLMYIVDVSDTTDSGAGTSKKMTLSTFLTSFVFADTVSGTINGSNVTFTVPNTITMPLILFLAGEPYQPTTDFTTSGTTITMVSAPNSSLSGQPFWLLHL